MRPLIRGAPFFFQGQKMVGWKDAPKTWRGKGSWCSELDSRESDIYYFVRAQVVRMSFLLRWWLDSSYNMIFWSASPWVLCILSTVSVLRGGFILPLKVIHPAKKETPSQWWHTFNWGIFPSKIGAARSLRICFLLQQDQTIPSTLVWKTSLTIFFFFLSLSLSKSLYVYNTYSKFCLGTPQHMLPVHSFDRKNDLGISQEIRLSRAFS